MKADQNNVWSESNCFQSPKQKDGTSCSAFVCMNAYCIFLGKNPIMAYNYWHRIQVLGIYVYYFMD